MPTCELCGKETEKIVTTLIEGVEMDVCQKCAKFGKIVQKARHVTAVNKRKETVKLPEKEIIEIIVSDYSKLIRDKREKLGFKQEELAKKLNIKESLLHKMETGNIEPRLSLARKLEKFLKLKLVEEQEVEKVSFAKKPGEALTIGDLIKKKK